MFHSNAQRLYAPLTIPTGLRSTLVLGASDLDISGGHALTSTDDFEVIEQNSTQIYWAKETNGALRVIVSDIGFNWQGDRYDLYLLDAKVAKEDFLSKIDSASDSAYHPVIAGVWRPPLVFQLSQHKLKWFIDVGEPYQVFSDWTVYSLKEAGPICTIVFNSPGKNPVSSLPPSVKKIASKLNEVLGQDTNEGTSHPIAFTRLHVQYVLANAALRPWALVDGDAYDSRSEVDTGLEEWAKVNNSRHRLYSEILKEYPGAEQSLAAYYENVYRLPPQKAHEVAVWVLDLVFRSYFSFPNGGDYFRYDGVRTNPWPLRLNGVQ
jgi:hypothetical protein